MSDSLNAVDHYSWQQVYAACHVGTADHEDTNIELAPDANVIPERTKPLGAD